MLAKIKKCEYKISGKHEEIDDLISKILVADPNERLSIEQIKNHPAFLKYLPDGYVLPKPLPLPNIEEPINPDLVDKRVIQILLEIGYKNIEELKLDFLSNERTMAKIFYFILKQQNNQYLMKWKGNQEQNECDNQNSDFYNLYEKNTGWKLFNLNYKKYKYEYNINNYSFYDLIYLIQQLLTKMKYDWYYPNEQILIAKIDEYEIISFEIKCSDNNILKLIIKANEPTEKDFQNIINEINSILST